MIHVISPSCVQSLCHCIAVIVCPHVYLCSCQITVSREAVLLAQDQFVFEGITYFSLSCHHLRICSHHQFTKPFHPHCSMRILRTYLKCYSFIECNKLQYWPGDFVFSSDTRETLPRAPILIHCAMVNCSHTWFYLDVFLCVNAAGKNHGSVLLSSVFISLMGERSCIFSENVEFSGVQKLVQQNVIRKKNLFSFHACSFLAQFFFFHINFLGVNNILSVRKHIHLVITIKI